MAANMVITTTAANAIAPAPGSIVAVIGPEGGLSEAEIDLCARAGFRRLQLGPRVLRTETAGPALLSAALALWGDLG